MLKFIGITVALVGFMMIAGSAGDCDGACMDQANTIGEMLAAIAMGSFLMMLGGFVAYKA
jgi:hypothetical protein